jgi:hypothetical protein
MGAVQNAMQRDGLDPSVMSLDPEKTLASQLENNESSIDKGTPLKDDPTYSKYFKMLKMVRASGFSINLIAHSVHFLSTLTIIFPGIADGGCPKCHAARRT